MTRLQPGRCQIFSTIFSALSKNTNCNIDHLVYYINYCNFNIIITKVHQDITFHVANVHTVETQQSKFPGRISGQKIRRLAAVAEDVSISIEVRAE